MMESDCDHFVSQVKGSSALIPNDKRGCHPRGGGELGEGMKLKLFSEDCLCSVMMIINNAMHKSVCYVMQSRMIKYKFMHTQIYPGSVTQTYIQSPGYT